MINSSGVSKNSSSFWIQLSPSKFEDWSLIYFIKATQYGSNVFFVKFQSEFISVSVHLKVNILEVEHVALDGKELGVYYSWKHSERNSFKEITKGNDTSMDKESRGKVIRKYRLEEVVKRFSLVRRLSLKCDHAIKFKCLLTSIAHIYPQECSLSKYVSKSPGQNFQATK